ncbi:PIG-L family deacetylase [Thiorhodococcus minor]|uniref:Glycosyl transferase group 2 family protein n=1 Tax=Thiorhodococcus minor TaxID=57489 RepID=A0A6M0K3C4_9GAMM|nr:PIG-L family deacetylase [Thiorhodococcus minor]NEV62815.1 glycosyl transferase group 2 family protein [Thiorhodococcus minor]
MKIREHDFIPYDADTAMPGASALVLAPHPDDEVLGCGGAIMRHVAAGEPVQAVIVTDGAFGSGQDRHAQAQARQQESRQAAAVLGYGVPDFWGLPDRGLTYGEPLIERILAAIETQRAELVYAPSWWEMHPDHFVLALATAEAARRCSRPLRLAMYEVGVPLHPNHLLDITDLVERKRAAIGCFASQLAQQRYDAHILALNTYRTYTLAPRVRAAEAYRILDRRELARDPLRMIRPGVYYTQNGSAETTPLPLVSAIIGWDQTHHAQIAHAKDTLDSIAIQTYPNIEILMPQCEDSPTWAERFPVRQLDAESPRSQAHFLNLALEAAKGDFVAILTDGSMLHPDHISVMVGALTATEDARCAYSMVHVAEETAKSTPAQASPAQHLDRLELWSGAQFSLARFLIARELVEDRCRFDESLAEGYAWDFLVQLSRKTNFLPVEHSSVRIPSKPAQPPETKVADTALEDPSLDAAFAKWQATWSPSELRTVIARQARRRMAAERSAHDRALELEGLVDVARRTQNDAETLRRQLAEATAQLQEHGMALDSARQEITALRRSTSWRLTAPLRRLMTGLKGARTKAQ